jgi:hypothetical protein
MKIEKVHNGIRYTLSNDNLKVNDKVYPIAHGRCIGDNDWILHDFDFRDLMSGFPDNPHTILNLKHSTYKPYEVLTDMGFSPVERYYKVIKKETQIKKNDLPFTSTEWVEIDDSKQKQNSI